ncbi:uncharacterized protein LACBIDRAFT_334420 [Laccaria bicolor S238N-H82]|uniref:Predicted protein n=1 Tax=Laccaria bicolor (strain S238N-H82 / ATCC MYA-4686) TaxID=486041 RepID=B0DZ59_LACBS|nr:uncharacterized protein LACBIDRAFT_334420 [Laccaria bicolor S238N-H82]EDR00178.1 predicted protein [Laccaria bicolor S238N-H82]|eukprot:XP_001889235.1 predicted protein [Laccaria bicolor S238N-H82]
MPDPSSSSIEEPAPTDQMEDLFAEYGINSDVEKKKKLGKYTDQRTEFEWKAFKTFEDSSFDKFKKALIADYPDARNAGKGTLTGLRAGTTKITHGAASTGCLTDSFADQVKASLNIEQTRDRKQKGNEDETTARRTEDPYDIIDIIDMAETIAGRLTGDSQDHPSNARAVLTGRSVQAREREIKTEHDEFEELRSITATFLDQIKVDQKQNSELRNMVQNMQIEMKKLLETLVHQQPNISNPQSKVASYKMTSDGCWYCDEPGHFTSNCPHREAHVAQKKIKLLGNRMYFTHNNTAVPRGNGEKSVRQIVEEASRQNLTLQNNMFAEPGEVFSQEAVVPGIIRLPDNNNGNEISVFTNQMRDTRDDVILNMNNQVLKLTDMLANLVTNPNKTRDVDASQFAVTCRSQTETQGQSGN